MSVGDGDEQEGFTIELYEIERESLALENEHYKVIWNCDRHGNAFQVAVWIEVGSVPAADLFRVAMHALHIVLTQLASLTEGWRITE